MQQNRARVFGVVQRVLYFIKRDELFFIQNELARGDELVVGMGIPLHVSLRHSNKSTLRDGAQSLVIER